MLLAALLLFAPSTAEAFECSHSNEHCFVSLWWPKRELTFNVIVPEDAAISRDEMIGAIDAAAARWNDVDCTDIRLVRTEEPSENEIRLITRGWDPKRPGAAGVTNVDHLVTTGEITRAIILINEPLVGVTDENTCAGFLDLETVLTHELGHFLGIAHPCETEETYPDAPLCPPARCEDFELEPDETISTMWPVIGSCDRQLATLEADDVAAICTLYPSASAARQCYGLPPTSQQRAIVESETFGCSASGGTPALWILALVPLIKRRRRRE
jgi:Synergist-CTERM protein sorting domain-containing protein